MAPSAKARAGPLGAAFGPLPRLFVGTSGMGAVVPLPLLGGPGERRAFALLDRLLELGCCAFDLAASYQLGGSERLLGAWAASRRCRDRLFLATKGALPLPVVRPHPLNRLDITADLHASLRRLQTDHVDLYLLHRDDPAAPLEPILETMGGLLRVGKIRAWGVSNWTVERIAAIDRLAEAAGVPGVAASSPHFSLAQWNRPPFPGTVSLAGDDQRPARDYYQESGLPVLAWSPLGSGFLTGPDAAANPRIWGSPVNVGRRRRAQELARARAVSLPQIALAYLLNQPFPVYPVVAAGSLDKVRDNLGATAIHLSEAELRWLESGAGLPRGPESLDPDRREG